MSTKLSSWSIVLLLAAMFLSIAQEASAQNSGRMAVVNRQRVQAMTNVAESDGWVTAQERQSILKTAKGTLSDSEYNYLENRLNLQSPALASRQGMAAMSDANLTAMLTQPASKSARPIEFASMGDGSEAMTVKEDGTPVDTGCDGSWAKPDFCDADTGWCGDCWDNISFFAGVDGFKGPMDLDNRNGNFGVRYGINAGLPLLELKNIGVQAGTAGVTSNFHGTQFTGSRTRTQNFTTVGIFQRYPNIAPRMSWGAAYDWLTDNYYSNIKLGQWRLKFAYDITCDSQVGLWACISGHGDNVRVGSEQYGYTNEHFRPITQVNAYYCRYFDTGMTTTFWLGGAEEPGSVVLGSSGVVPVSQRASLYGGFQYIVPGASGEAGQDEEMWNVSVGLTVTLGPCGNGGRPGLFQPFFNVADNALFGVRRD
ncbi:MAG: hypothetical protein JXM70_29660 [Pirellulales bacterium]|nr:hypothetical protein [Pirellulales bacterium]